MAKKTIRMDFEKRIKPISKKEPDEKPGTGRGAGTPLKEDESYGASTQRWTPMAEGHMLAKEAPEVVAEKLLHDKHLKLSDSERKIVMKILDGKKRECTRDDLVELIKMGAGVRELRIELLKSCISAHDNVEKRSRREQALATLIQKMRYYLPEATDSQKRDAVLDASNLSIQQKSVIRKALLLPKSHDLQEEDVEKFLETAEGLDARERAKLWRKSYIDFYTFGQLMVSLRNAVDEGKIGGICNCLSKNEKKLASFLLSKDTTPTDEELEGLYDRLKFFDSIIYSSRKSWSEKQAKLVEQMRKFNSDKMINPVKRLRDYRILLGFAGIELELPRVEISEIAFTVPKFKKEKGGELLHDSKGELLLEDVNGDSAISADVYVPWENRRLRLCAVFDGVGGGLSKDGKRTDHIASDIAHDMVKVGMRSGIVEKPADFLALLYAADMAIRVYVIENYSQEHGITSNFGSTAAITILEGRKMTAITTGDSRWMVFDSSGKPKDESTEHSVYEVVKNPDRWKLPRTRVEMYCMQSTNISEDQQRGMIISSLGVGGPVDITERELDSGDIIVTVSDGVSDLVCEHMIIDTIKPVVEKEKDPERAAEKAADAVFEMVDDVIKNGGEYPECGCWVADFKNDDKSFGLLRVEE